MALVVLAVGAVQGSAGAAIEHHTMVSETPAPFAQAVITQTVPEPRVDAIARAGGVVYLGGRFDRMKDDSGEVARGHVAAVDESSGQLLPFAPFADARVRAVTVSGEWVYLGGDFTTIDGVARRALARVNALTGQVDPGFNARLRGKVYDLEIARGQLFVSGNSGRRLVALDLTSGASTGYLDQEITGEAFDDSSGVQSWGSTTVYNFDINPAATKLVAVGNFDTVDGQYRERAFMLDLSDDGTSLSPWYYKSFGNRCATVNPRRIAYLQNVDFSPDGSYFVVVATGQVPYRISEIGETVCDAAARFESDIISPNRPTWINYTGGDSLWGVAVTGAAVYVQGHQRWLDNPYGRNDYAPPAVVRRGIGAIDPGTGLALPWDPRKPAQVGGSGFLATDTGLWVGSDSLLFNGQPRACLAFLPLQP